jgi:hypothetical protein
VVYTLGLIASLGASFFLLGPKKHWTRLKEEPAHAISLVVVFIAVVMVFVSCCGMHGSRARVLAVIFILIELVALAIFYLSMNMLTWGLTKSLFRAICRC